MSNTRSTTRRARPPAKRAQPKKAAADTITFMGAEYKVADKVGIWPQMMLARAAQDGVTLGDMRGLAAIHATLENVIDVSDWGRFQDDMIAKKTDDLAVLLDLVTQAAKIVAGRSAAPASGQNGSAPAEETPEDAVPGEVVKT